MKRILIGYLIDGTHSGIDKYLLNVIAQIRGEDVKIDCLTNKIDLSLQERLNDQGVGLLEIPSLKHPLRQLRRMREIIRAGQYDVAYFNISEAFNCIGILAAHKEKVPCVAAHSHSSGIDERNAAKYKIRSVCHNFMKKRVMSRCVTDYYACSKKAGEWLFTEKTIRSDRFHVINNAVDVDKFGFQKELREKKRRELGLEDRFVVGQIGFIGFQKNPEFVVEIAKELKELCPSAVVLMIGDGAEREQIEALVTQYQLQDTLRLLGIRPDVNELLQAMDFFLLPSRFEGLPIVAIEAQISGLKVLISDSISEETALSDRCMFYSLRQTARSWAKKLLEERDYDRESWTLPDCDYCFDIHQQRKQIAAIFGIEQ